MNEIPSQAGSYVLWLRIAKESQMRIGRLGTGHFPEGDYLYFGSAHGPGGLRARISHHLRPPRSPHWHLDWLRGSALPRAVWWVADDEPLECQEYREPRECEMVSFFSRPCSLEPGRAIMPGFGSSDCRRGCAAHLLFFGTMVGSDFWRIWIEETLKRLSGPISDRGFCDCAGPGDQDARSQQPGLG